MSNVPRNPAAGGDSESRQREQNSISPLDGEAGIPDVATPRPVSVSRKGVFAVAMLVITLVVVSALSLQRLFASGKQEAESRLASDRPTTATSDPRRLDLRRPPRPIVPAIQPVPEDAPEPITVQRTPAPSGTKPIPPEDAPVVLLSSKAGPPGTGPTNDAPNPNADPFDGTRRNLEAYQRQLQGLLDGLSKGGAAALNAPGAASAVVPDVGSAKAPFLGGQFEGSSTPRVTASMLGNRSLTLPKGTAFTCALKTRLISAASGLVGCQVQRNVYSDDGRVLLIERGSHLDGEYRVASVRPGTVRIPVLWSRIRTPHGVTVDIDSPATGQLGESGIDGYVDNRWLERIGAALLLSVIDDSVKLIVQGQASDGNADTIVLPSTTSNTSKLAEKVLDSTINIPPLIYQNQGGIVGIYVARDVDFSLVYELGLVAR